MSSPKIPLWLGALIFLLLLGLVYALQRESGVWESEFGGHPDEAAHVLSGLMIRDYLWTGLGTNPAAFARDYYEHYPKVAIGHYPPGFYVVEAAWLSVFPPSHASLMWFMAAQAALFGWLAFRLTARSLGLAAGVWVGVLCVLLPITQRHTTLFMSDLMLAIFCLLAVEAFRAYLDKPTFWRSLAFGFLAACAAMVKGSGLLLALVPGLAILFTGRFSLLRKLSLWVAPIPVVVIVFPWMVLTYHITDEGMVHQPLLAYLGEAIPYYGRALVGQFGWVLLSLALAGVACCALQAVRRRQLLSADRATMLALALAVIIFYLLVPSGLDERYLLPAAPALLYLAALFLRTLADWRSRRNEGFFAAAALVALVLVGREIFRVPEQRFAGFAPVTEVLSTEGGKKDEVLISSDASGEGAFIAEIALADDRPGHKVLRSSKVISESDWIGRNYDLHFKDPAALIAYLRTSGIRWIVIDRSIPPARRLPHHELLEKALLDDAPAGFTRVGAYPLNRRASAETAEVVLIRKD